MVCKIAICTFKMYPCTLHQRKSVKTKVKSCNDDLMMIDWGNKSRDIVG